MNTFSKTLKPLKMKLTRFKVRKKKVGVNTRSLNNNGLLQQMVRALRAPSSTIRVNVGSHEPTEATENFQLQ